MGERELITTLSSIALLIDLTSFYLYYHNLNLYTRFSVSPFLLPHPHAGLSHFCGIPPKITFAPLYCHTFFFFPRCSEWILQGLKVSGCEATLAAYSQLCAELDSAKEQRQLAQGQLQAKKNRIDRFTELVVMIMFTYKPLVWSKAN